MPDGKIVARWFADLTHKGAILRGAAYGAPFQPMRPIQAYTA